MNLTNPKVFNEMLELYSALIEVERDVCRKRRVLGEKLMAEWPSLEPEAQRTTKTLITTIMKESKLAPREDDITLEWIQRKLR